METQSQQLPRRSHRYTPSAPPEPKHPSQASAAPLSLRFPNLDVDERIAYLVSSSAPDIMATPHHVSDVESLADSAYEIISSADDESQDGRRAESLAEELDLYPHSDDVQSLSNDKGYDDEDDDEEDEEESVSDQANPEHHSRTDSIRYAEAALEHTSTMSSSPSEDLLEDRGTPLSRSIEFVEADSPVYLETTSVMHTIRDFSEDESATIALALDMENPPKRLAATIRQTMSHHCLSTWEPLRVLYVGSEAGRTEITHKISSAFLASQASGRVGDESATDSDGVFNIVPIAAFGASKVPERDEIQLMGVSDYYIKLERCTSAEEVAHEGDSSTSDSVYSITIDDGKTYVSAYNARGSVVQPKWTLPHVAVFYLSKNDDEKEKHTRNAAWEFMTRHGIPSLFISHAQSFETPTSGRWKDFVDKGGVHLCLESRDPERPATLRRLPIDLASFLNIDARQMNRNLAYLTGLYESPISSDDDEEEHVSDPGEDSTFTLRCGHVKHVDHLRDRRAGWAGMPLALFSGLLLGLVSLVMLLFSSPGASLMKTPLVGFSSISESSTTCSPPTVTPTVTISFTSTKTVKLSAEASSTTQFGGFLSDKPQASVVEPESVKKMACSIEVFSDSEILVKVPGGTKTSWLAKGAIDIDVWRGTEMIKSKLSTTDEGIVIEISKKDAYGVMNVSVVTTRRPKINETFAVDFGKPTLFRMLEAADSLAQSLAYGLGNTAGKLVHAAENNIEMVMSLSGNIQQAKKAAHDYSSRVKEEVFSRAKESLNSHALQKALRTAQDQAAQQLQATEHIRDEINLKLLRAQIASKLWWLKVQGRDDEYARYQAKSSEFLKSKEATQGKRTQEPKEETRRSWGRGRRSPSKKTCEGKTKGKWRSLGCEL